MAHSAKLIGRLGQVALGTDPWPGDVRLSDIEPLFVCQACGRRGADIRPDWDWDTQPKVHRTLSALARCTPL